MMPIVFCASLEPSLVEYAAAETSCSFLNSHDIVRASCFQRLQESTTDSSIPMVMPSSGETKMPRIGLTQPLVIRAPNPALAIAAPAKPPRSAWDDDDGRPNHHVIRFQAMAPMSAAHITVGEMTSGTMSPLEIVFATAVPRMNAARKLNDAAQRTANRGDRTRVATTV